MRRFGRYTLLGELARGGMAAVYAAELTADAGFRKRVAIKRMRPHLVCEPEYVRMFLEEARIGSQLSHPKICEIYELSQINGEYYIAMEYLHGVTLSTLLGASCKAERKLPVPAVVGMIAQACEGLHYAHERKDGDGNPLGVLHRDISPQNLFIRHDGVVKVLDFGIAKADDSSHHTKTGTLKGKEGYMSPEQLEGRPLDRRSDVWSLGVVLFEALAGARLFRRPSLLETARAIDTDPIPQLRKLRADVPESIDAVLSRTLCREREWRFESADALRVALLEAIGIDQVATLDEIGDLVRNECAAALDECEEIFDRGAELIDFEDESPPATDPDLAIPEMSASHEVEIERATLRLRPADRVVAPTPVLADPEWIDTNASDLEYDRDEPRWSDTDPEIKRGASLFLRLAFVVALVAGAAGVYVLMPMEAKTTPATAATMHPEPAPDPLDIAPKVVQIQEEEVEKQPKRPEMTFPEDHLGIPPVAEQEPTLAPEPREHSAPAKKRQASDTAAPHRSAEEGGSSAEPDAARSKRARPTPAVIRKRRRPARKEAPPSPALPPPAAPVESKPGALYVDSEPYATIYVDGRKYGVTPLLGERLPAGKHTLRAVNADGQVKTIQLDVAPGESVRKRFRW